MNSRWLGLALAGAALAGCSKPPALRSDLPAGATLEASLAASAGAASVTASTSLARPATSLAAIALPAPGARLGVHLPPAAGRVVRTVERTDLDSGERRLLSSGGRDAGENYVDLAYRIGASTVDAARKPSAESIAAELAREFPGTAMKVVPTPRYNAYGQYGLAVGRSAAGERCIYGWQWIDGDGLAKVAPEAAYASVRVRLCRSDATLDQLATHVERLALKRDEGVRRATGRGRRPRAVVGAAEASPAGPVAVAAAPVAPSFPSPWSTSRGSGSPRYMAPVTEAAPRRAAERPATPQGGPAAARGPASPAVGSSLPAEAFRGPARSGVVPPP